MAELGLPGGREHIPASWKDVLVQMQRQRLALWSGWTGTYKSKLPDVPLPTSAEEAAAEAEEARMAAAEYFILILGGL